MERLLARRQGLIGLAVAMFAPNIMTHLPTLPTLPSLCQLGRVANEVRYWKAGNVTNYANSMRLWATNLSIWGVRWKPEASESDKLQYKYGHITLYL